MGLLHAVRIVVCPHIVPMGAVVFHALGTKRDPISFFVHILSALPAASGVHAHAYIIPALARDSRYGPPLPLRAPTDESVRLLREMEQKAHDSILFAIRCDANPFKFRAIVWDDWSAFRKMAHINFTLGDKEYDVEVEVPRHTDSREKCVIAVRDAIVKELANILTVNLASEHFLR